MSEEFGPEFSDVIDEFGFKFPFNYEFDQEFSSYFLDSPKFFHTLGGSDAIYIPYRRKQYQSIKNQEKGVETDLLSIAEMEEYLHLYDLRTSSSGWILEVKKRAFAQDTYKYINNQISRENLLQRYLQLKRYNVSLELPLEYLARVKAALEIKKVKVQLEKFKNNALDISKVSRLFDLSDPSGIQSCNGNHYLTAERNYRELIKLLNVDQLAPIGSIISDEELKLVNSWWEKVAHLSNKFYRRHLDPFAVLFSARCFICLYMYPARLALYNTTKKYLTFHFGESEVNNIHNSSDRIFIEILKTLCDIPDAEYLRYIKAGIDYCDDTSQASGIKHFLETKVANKLDLSSLGLDIPCMKAIQEMKKISWDHFAEEIIPTFLWEGTIFIASPLRVEVNKDSCAKNILHDKPSILLFPIEKQNRKRFVATANIDDKITKQLLAELKMIHEGLKIVREEESLQVLENFKKDRILKDLLDSLIISIGDSTQK